MDKKSSIFVAGHRGLVGASLTRHLESQGFTHLILAPKDKLDLTNQAAVEAFFIRNKIDYVFVCAARVGGIFANHTYPADFIYDNLMIATNMIHAAATHGVRKLLYLGSSCIYPKLAPQPMKEESLLTGPLEPTNEAYAIAKIAGLKLCQFYQKQYGKQFISAMPTNLYGPNDNFHPENSHVLPGLLRRFHEAKLSGAKEVVVWGTGAPLREFLYVDDLVEALVLLMEQYNAPEIINVGSGQEISIRDLAHTVKEVTQYSGEIRFDNTHPDGSMRKLLDTQKMRDFGWTPRTLLKAGLNLAYRWALDSGAFTSQLPSLDLPVAEAVDSV